MYSKNYDFNTTRVVKIIVQNKRNKILIIQEPEDNEWMPLHWGLPGGKPTEKESLLETFKRKSKTDVGQKLKLSGILEIEELLLKGKSVVMYIVLARAILNKVKGEAKKYKWVSKEDVEKMKLEEFTEYYNKELLINFFEGKLSPIPFKTIKTWEYYKIGDRSDYKKWFDSGKKRGSNVVHQDLLESPNPAVVSPSGDPQL